MTERKNPASSFAASVSRIKDLSNGLEEQDHSASLALLYNDYAIRNKLKALLLPEESLIASSVAVNAVALTQLLKVL